MTHSRIRCCVLLLVLLCAASAADASNFTVSPTELNLSAGATSTLVTLRNQDKRPLRFEIAVFAWSEDEHGQMSLTPSADVTFFPKLVELAPGASRNVRVGISASVPRDTEVAFRLFVEELPDQSAPQANAVAIRTKIGIPVFVRPGKPTRSAQLERVTIEGGKILTRVRNTGNLHISVDSIAATGITAAKSPAFSKTGTGWYVLPGATRIFEIPLSAAECSGATSVAVEVFGHDTSIKSSAAVPPGACAAR